MNKKYLSLGLAVAVLLALFGMALQDPLRFPVINRAVTAVRTGKNTFYTLTPAGQRYCSKKQGIADR